MSTLLRQVSCVAGLASTFGLILGAVICLLPGVLAADGPAGRLDIAIRDIDERLGSIVVAIFASKATFDERIDPVAQARLPIDGNAVSWSTELDAPAPYAVIVYQDLNENGEIDMRRFGRPREPYGFSNNVRGTFGPPGFDEARFRLEPEGLSIVIEID